MKKVKMGIVFIILCSLCCACNNVSSEDVTDSEESSAYDKPETELDNLENIDTDITDTLVEKGYSVEHASSIHEILNTIGIEDIEVKNMTGEAETGLNAVICYANGSVDEDRKFHFTTEDGVLFYAGFLDEDLYDSASGGFLKNYSDVHVPEKEVSFDVYNELQQIASDEVKQYLNNPDTADFNAFRWGIGRSDEHYQVLGAVTAENGLGAEEEIPFSVWFADAGDKFLVEGIALDGIRIK